MTIQPPADAPYTMDEIVWDVPTLRMLMQQMLARFNVSSVELMSQWDNSGDGKLSLAEFQEAIRKLFGDHKVLWEREARAVVTQAFAEIDMPKASEQSMQDRVRALTGKESAYSWVRINNPL